MEVFVDNFSLNHPKYLMMELEEEIHPFDLYPQWNSAHPSSHQSNQVISSEIV